MALRILLLYTFHALARSDISLPGASFPLLAHTHRQELSLGSQTIHVNIPGASKKGDMTSTSPGRLVGTSTSASPHGLIKLAPPPPPPPAPTTVKPAPPSEVFDPFSELSTARVGPSAPQQTALDPFSSSLPPAKQPSQSLSPAPAAANESNWATFV